MITNETGLSAAVYAAVANDTYSKGRADISVTDLLAPPRMVTLKVQHKDSLVEDVADMAARFIGTTVHDELEKHKQTEESETRVFIDVAGWVVGGKPDHFDPTTGHLQDYKTIKASEYMYGLKEERTQQLNIYAEMLRLNGYEVNKLSAILFIVDFSWPAQERDRRYPPRSIVEVPIEMWPRERTQQFIRDRVAVHRAARVALPECTNEEKWQHDDYAIKRDGTKNALKVFKSSDGYGLLDAETWGIEQGIAEMAEGGVVWAKDHSVEQRVGRPTRCRWYCSVASVCDAYQGELNG